MSNSTVCVMHGLIAMAILGTAGSAIAQTPPRALDASPEIYRVVAQDDKNVIVEANYRPGQRSNFFSSSASLVYFVSDCHLRTHFPDGRVVDEGPAFAGYAGPAPARDSVAIENVGRDACRTISVAPK